MTLSRRFPIIPLVALILLIALVNGLAVYWHLYFLIWWLDIPMHILGGLWVASFGLVWYYSLEHRRKDHSSDFVIAIAIALSLFVGLLWEVFELSSDWALHAYDYTDLVDTLKDLLDDLIGGIIAAGIFLKGRYNK